MSAHPLQAACQDALDALVSQTAGVGSAAVVTSDGFEVASVLHADLSVEKLAAMTSSLLALSEAVASESTASTRVPQDALTTTVGQAAKPR